MKKGNDVEACMLVVQRCLAAAAAAVHRSRWRASGRWCPFSPFTLPAREREREREEWPITHQPWLSCIDMIKGPIAFATNAYSFGYIHMVIYKH